MRDRTLKCENPYTHMYQDFFDARGTHTGYHFGENPSINKPPPVATFDQPLKWWSLNRPERLKKIRQVRDQYLLDILILHDKPQTCTNKLRTRRKKYKGLITTGRARRKDLFIPTKDEWAA